MKKFLAFILALACALSLMACGKKNNDDKPDPDPAPDPQPTVITAEFTHGYVDMALDLPEGWSWEQVSDNGTDKTEGIRFYKTDDPTVSYTLLCWRSGSTRRRTRKRAPWSWRTSFLRTYRAAMWLPPPRP